MLDFHRYQWVGGAGFSGSHIADEMVATTDWNVVVLDALTYAGRLDRLAHLPADRVQVVYHDFREPLSNHVFSLLWTRDIEYIIHNGAETREMKRVKRTRFIGH